jgi:hypothetical protein
MDLSNQANALSQMFDQLDGSLRSEITAIDVRERRRNDGRKKWNAFAAGILSLIGVSVGFVIAFLGVNTTEVPGNTGKQLSMWDPHFAYLYLIAGAFALVPVFLIAFPYLREWASQSRTHGPLWWGLAVTLTGVLLFTVMFVADRAGAGRTMVIDDLGKTVAVFLALAGTTTAALYRWHHRTR